MLNIQELKYLYRTQLVLIRITGNITDDGAVLKLKCVKFQFAGFETRHIMSQFPV